MNAEFLTQVNSSDLENGLIQKLSMFSVDIV